MSRRSTLGAIHWALTGTKAAGERFIFFHDGSGFTMQVLILGRKVGQQFCPYKKELQSNLQLHISSRCVGLLEARVEVAHLALKSSAF